MIELPVLDKPGKATAPSASTGSRVWRSIEQLAGHPDFKKVAASEFMPGALDKPSGATRRQFLQLMGASTALAGLTACRRPIETIVPHTRRPEDVIPGQSTYYATHMPFRGLGIPVLVESVDGRPIKIEGNPDHPISGGSSMAFAQASILNVYDPDRSASVLNNGAAADANGAIAALQALAQNPSARIAFVVGAEESPTLDRLRVAVAQKFAASTWFGYRPEGASEAAAGVRSVTGRSARVVNQMSNADVILSLDADFLGSTNPSLVLDAGGFAAKRRVESTADDMSRLYVAESQYSVTGSMADHRLRMKASAVGMFAGAVARALGMSGFDVSGLDESTLNRAAVIAADLQNAGSNALVVAGDTQPAAVHALALAMNDRLGSVGTTVTLVETSEAFDSASTQELTQLASDLSDGRYSALVMLGVNPVYDLPDSVGFASAIKSVATSIHLGHHADETAQVAQWHIPATHYLEAWGDVIATDGTLGVVQPLIAPLNDVAMSSIEVLGTLISGDVARGHDLVRQTWNASSGDTAWRRIIHDGFSSRKAAQVSSPVRMPQDFALPLPVDGVEVVLRYSPAVLDGSFANNAWMLELPDPATKITWDNVALMSPDTAERLGATVTLKNGQHFADRVAVETAAGSVDLPAWILPGIAEDSIQLVRGYGRSLASNRARREEHFFDLDHETDVYGQGPVGSGIGVRVSGAVAGSVVALRQLSVTGSNYLIATTQDHGALDDEIDIVAKRGLIRTATLDEYRQDPDFVKAGEPKPIREDWADYPTLWEDNHPSNQAATKDNPYYAHQWGMVIDLNACSGCSACVIACQSENNIQVVGKDQISRGRELSWLRMDRYFVSDVHGEGEHQMVTQPLPCQHCENAPCESVCPVAATVHSPDGTNQMIYNRCIGTRYCANNCPYKVRRFNYYNWSKTLPTTVQLAQNPNVTVRSRGVMEKCSFCVQRIRAANKQANLENRALVESDVTTACQQACPTQAITFGDLNDPNSAVTKARQNDRRYELLAELNLKPRTSYLGRLRNPNPAWSA